MKWEGHEESSNVDDRRGRSAGRAGGLTGRRGIGLGTIVIALLAGWLFGINPLTVLGVLSGSGGLELPANGPTSHAEAPANRPAEENRAASFAKIVLRDTEVIWDGLLQQAGARYEPPTMVLYTGATNSGCGTGQAAMGPFYCPADAGVYLDLGFFETLSRRLGAPGDFAQAYVIAHEVGHHLQNLMGITAKVDRMRGRVSPAEMNAISVRVELQADCLAGVWAHHSQKGKGWLEAGDIQEGLNAAAQIGDDTLQRAAQGRVVPETFTHGTSDQRMRWFKRGLDGGSIAQCDTFSVRQL